MKSDIKLFLSRYPGTFAEPYHSSTVTLNPVTLAAAAFLTITEIGFFPKLVKSSKSFVVVELRVFLLTAGTTLFKNASVSGYQNLSWL